MTHGELVRRAERWLLGSGGCTVAFTEMSTAAGEIPDAIGFRGTRSVVVECKASRSDFMADRKKPHRRVPEIAMGGHRYFMSLPSVIDARELPAGWGLLHVVGGRVRRVRESESFADRATHREVAFLVSMLRRAEIRLQAGVRPDWRLNNFLRWEAEITPGGPPVVPQRSAAEGWPDATR